MALFQKCVLINSTSESSVPAIAGMVDRWLEGFDKTSEDQFFAVVVDRKHKETRLAYSPKTRHINNISDEDNFHPFVELSNSINQEADSQQVEKLALNKIMDCIDTEKLKDDIIKLEQDKIPVISESDLMTQVTERLSNQMLEKISVAQAQNDIVAGGIKFLTSSKQMQDIVESVYIGAFRDQVHKLTKQNADLIAALDNQNRVTINIT